MVTPSGVTFFHSLSKPTTRTTGNFLLPVPSSFFLGRVSYFSVVGYSCNKGISILLYISILPTEFSVI